MKPLVEAFFDRPTCTVTYVVHVGDGSARAVIDSVLDYDPKAGRIVQAHCLNPTIAARVI